MTELVAKNDDFDPYAVDDGSRRLWNRNYIDHIEITATEKLGVEQRGLYYDSAGALRDMVQSHLLQIMAFIAMEPPATFEPEAIRDEIAKVFRSLRPLSPDDIARLVAFTKSAGGIDYAERVMRDYGRRGHELARTLAGDGEVGQALTEYVDYVVERNM